jgi:gliding motility-associated-like protein
MKFKFYCAALLVALLTTFAATSQDFSNKGKEFWLAFPNHVPSGNNLAKMALFITSDKNSTGTISVNGFTTNFAVAANQVSGPIDIPYSNAHVSTGETGVVVNKGISVKVNNGQPPVVVYAHIYAAARSAASLILPVTALGRKYYSSNYWQSSTGGSQSQFQVIAVEANTTIRIQRRRDGILDPNVTTMTLNNPGDLLQIQDPKDLTGTIIESVSSAAGGCKKIAVFSGSSAVSIGGNGCFGGSFDPLYQQLYPTNTWGKNFGVINFSNNPNGYHLRVTAAENNTTVNVGGSIISLNAGEYYPATTANPTSFVTPMAVTADKPISVAQYMMSANCANVSTAANQGDPDMVILNPTEQNINDISIFSSNLQVINSKFLTVYIPTVAAPSFRINNVPPTSNFVPMVPNNGYSYLVENLTSLTNPSFRLTADSGFNAIAYGLGDFETYAYSAGTNVRDLYQFVSLQNQYASVNFTTTCKNTPFYLSMTFPYQPTQIQWDFGTLFAPLTLNAPVHDSTWVVNGRQLYRYKIMTPFSVPNTGTYPIKVTAQNPTPDGCNGVQEISYDLQVIDRPTADFNFTTNGCVSDSVRFFDNASTGGFPAFQWNWSFGDGKIDSVKNPVHLFSSAGTYTVSYAAITEMGCISDTVTKTVILTQPPVANFNIVLPSCAGKAISFTDASSTTSSTIAKWYWNFGDGSPQVIATSNAQQTHIYNTPGSYAVTLKVETAGGCQSTVFTKQVVVSPNPVAAFQFGGACLPSGSVQFTNTSTISDGTENSLTYLWNFGNGNNSAQQNPLHPYGSAGPFNVTLTVTSAAGCTDDSTRIMNTVFAQPQAQFTVAAEACLGSGFSFSDQSTAAASTVTEWFWNFGDNTTSSQQNPAKQYAAPGTYTVKLYIRSAAGCFSDTAIRTVTVLAPPTASFSIAGNLCINQNIQFNSTSVPNAGVISTYQWSVNSISIGTSQNATYSPPATGTYNIQLIVITDKGCRDTLVQSMVINPRPFADFTLPNVCLPSGTAQFTSLSTISDGSLLTYTWTFGDGGNATVQNPIHNYVTAGPFSVHLTVVSDKGCIKDTTKVLNTVFAQPVAVINSPADVCFGSAASFTDASTAAGSTVTQWQWNFGDGNQSALQNPSHTYTTPGNYTVSLIITSAAGCVSARVTRNVVVNPPPTATFSVSVPNCVTKDILFIDASVSNGGNIVKWSWNMGDGPTVVRTTNTPFTHSYATSGTFQVTLVVETDKGCISQLFSRQVLVSPLPVPDFTLPENCLDDPFAQFNDLSTISDGSQAGFSYLWNFGDPNASAGNPNTSTQKNPQHRYIQARNYDVTLTVTSSNGCSAAVNKIFTVNGSVPQAVFTVEGPADVCSGKNLTLRNNSTVDFGTVTKLEVFWDYTNDPTNKTTDQDPVPGKTYTMNYAPFFAPATKTVTIRVVAYSGDNCLHSSVQTIILKAVPQLQFGAVAPVCGDVAPFTITAASITNGIAGAGIYSGPGVDASGLFSPATAGPGVHSIRYTYTTTNGCDAFIERDLEVFQMPTVDAGPDRVALEGGNVVLLGTGTGPGITYTWTPSTYLNTPSVARPVVTPAADIIYTLRVTTGDGCTITDAVSVKMLKMPLIPNVFTPNGDGINDTWMIAALDSYPGCTVNVYNRYGQLVYQSTGYLKPWDGTSKGKELAAGTYYYIINPKNGRQQMTGFVDIVK